MSLQKCADTVVGDSFNRGISGGEKKRTSIGIELVSNPNLLFLDEPTTGLDSTTAYDIIKALSDLSKKGITLVSTIHAPSQEILELFDNLIILSNGYLVYDGPPQKVLNRINKLDFRMKEFTPPLEYFMEIINKDYLKIEFEQKERELGHDNQILDKEFEERINKINNYQKKITQKHFKSKPNTDREEKGLYELRERVRVKNKMRPITE